MNDKAAEQEDILNEGAGDINPDGTEEQETGGNEPVEEMDELQKLQAEIEELKDKNLRLVAEFDNFRKRSAKERVDTIMTAGKDIIKDLLDVIDDSNRAMKQMETDDNPDRIKEGATLVFNKLQHILQAKGLKVMDCTGKDFDADLHEAITEIPAPTEDMKGKVVDVVQQGYYLNDKLIRHAKVVVGA